MAKLPKKIQDIFDSKEAYLDTQRNKLEKSVSYMQEKFLNDVISDIVSELDTENGVIKQTPKNLRLINQLEATYEAFNKSIQVPVIKDLATGLLGLNKLNSNYFKEIILDTTTKARFAAVTKTTDTLLAAKIGVSPKGDINAGGFLDSFLTDRTVVNDIKQMTIRAVTGQMPISDYKGLLKYKMLGDEDRLGGFERYYQQFAYDTYQQYDRTYGKVMADEFKMNYALYQGGLIKDSREFCIFHNDQVWTREEINQFGSWKDSEGKTPSYLKVVGYSPEIDCGGPNCRHSLSWISKSLAERLRPELKDKK